MSLARSRRTLDEYMTKTQTVIAIAGIILIALFAGAQEIPIDDAIRLEKLDGASNILFFGRGVLSPTSPPIRAYTPEGLRRGTDISIFGSISGIQKALVDDIASGPNDSTLVAAVLIYPGEHNTVHALLTFDAGGRLRKVWDTFPYYINAVTADEAGNVFALANRLDHPKAAYPLVIEYSAEGAVLNQFLPSSLFAHGAEAIDGIKLAEASIVLRDNKLLIYAPVEQEIIVCKLNGDVVRRAKVDSVLSRVAQDAGLGKAYVRQIIFTDESHVVMDVDIVNEDPQGRAVTGDTPLVFELNLNSMHRKVLMTAPLRDWKIAGANAGGFQLLDYNDHKRAVLRTRTIPAQ
jgi:hypothetical protein